MRQIRTSPEFGGLRAKLAPTLPKSSETLAARIWGILRPECLRSTFHRELFPWRHPARTSPFNDLMRGASREAWPVVCPTVARRATSARSRREESARSFGPTGVVPRPPQFTLARLFACELMRAQCRGVCFYGRPRGCDGGVPGEAGLGREKRLPDTHPGKLPPTIPSPNMCPNIVDNLPHNIWATFVQIWNKIDQVLPNWAKSWTIIWPKLGNI